MAFYAEYKPFRNCMRQFDLLASLVDVWRYSLHVTENQSLPVDYPVGKRSFTVRGNIHPWELDVLAKELVLNAQRGGNRSLKNWTDLTIAINHIRRLEEVAFKQLIEAHADGMLELHRIAHRQFPWQIRMDAVPIIRAFKIFGEAEVEAIIIRDLGMTMRQFLLLGAAVSGHFLKRFAMSTNQDYGALGISREASEAFFSRITCTVEQLRAEIAKCQSYDRDWLYTWNPLAATPLVGVDSTFPDRVICPIPRYLIRRASSGIFYDLVKAIGFGNAFGKSFQNYVGEVIKTTCLPPRFSVLEEEPYYMGTQKMHGVDWVLSDSTGHLFIESKAKRLTLDAKTRSDAVALEKDLIVMATAIVQHYRNVRDALDGKTTWKPDGLPAYPMILTLEDWFVFVPMVEEMLNEHVCRLLGEAAIPEEVLTEMPYTIASAQEFEIASQLLNQITILSFMTKKTSKQYRSWTLIPFMADNFAEQMKFVNWHLFSEEFLQLIPDAYDK